MCWVGEEGQRWTRHCPHLRCARRHEKCVQITVTPNMARATEAMGVVWKFMGTRKKDRIRWLDQESFKEEVPWGFSLEGWEGVLETRREGSTPGEGTAGGRRKVWERWTQDSGRGERGRVQNHRERRPSWGRVEQGVWTGCRGPQGPSGGCVGGRHTLRAELYGQSGCGGRAGRGGD